MAPTEADQEDDEVANSSLVDRFLSAPELGERSLRTTLVELVRAPSVNPGMSEEGIVGTIERLLEGIGCTTTRVEFAPGRPSLAAVLEGRSKGGPRLVLNGHVDTVAVDDQSRWTVDPFEGAVKDGAVWGRGAVDMKGGLTSQIGCLRTLASYRDRLRGSLVVHFAAGEECGEPGTRSLLDHGFTGDWGITTEPTSLTVATAQRGVGWFRIRVDGRSSHASRPADGLNPCDALASMLSALSDYAVRLRSRTHPLLGCPTCVVSMVHAGVQHNAVADFAELTVDRRLIPGETQASVQAELEQVIDLAGCRSAGYVCTLARLHHPFEPAEVSAASPFVDLLQRVRRQACGGEAAITGTAYGSDVRNLILDAGMEAVTFGPGDPSFCHTVDERVPISDLRAAALTVTAVAYELLT